MEQKGILESVEEKNEILLRRKVSKGQTLLLLGIGEWNRSRLKDQMIKHWNTWKYEWK